MLIHSSRKGCFEAKPALAPGKNVGRRPLVPNPEGIMRSRRMIRARPIQSTRDPDFIFVHLNERVQDTRIVLEPAVLELIRAPNLAVRTK